MWKILCFLKFIIINGKHRLPKKAVDLTRGLVMIDTDTDTLIIAYFHSTSGGVTAAAGDVWGICSS